MSDLVLDKIDAVNMKIQCDDSIAKELNMFFTFAVPNYQYTPAYKNKKWDGMIRLFNLYSRRLYIGLYDYLKKFAEDRNLSIEFNNRKIQAFDVGATAAKLFYVVKVGGMDIIKIELRYKGSFTAQPQFFAVFTNKFKALLK